jgi:hypothetical protein
VRILSTCTGCPLRPVWKPTGFCLVMALPLLLPGRALLGLTLAASSRPCLLRTSCCCPFRPSSIDLSFVDYDSTRFHMSTPTSKRIIQLSMSIRCWPDLVRYGVNETMEREFGEWLSPDGVEEGFDITLVLDFEKIPEEGGTSLLSPQHAGGTSH